MFLRLKHSDPFSAEALCIVINNLIRYAKICRLDQVQGRVQRVVSGRKVLYTTRKPGANQRGTITPFLVSPVSHVLIRLLS